MMALNVQGRKSLPSGQGGECLCRQVIFVQSYLKKI